MARSIASYIRCTQKSVAMPIIAVMPEMVVSCTGFVKAIA
jgi:hypothetical protein